jgi:hypothetical protein
LANNAGGRLPRAALLAFDLPNNAARGKQKDRETEVLWCNF